MPLRRSLIIAVTLIATVLVVVQAPNAEAAPYKTHHSGVIVATPRQLVAYNGGRAAVKPAIWIGPGRRRQVLDYVTMAYQNGRRVARGHTLYLRAGSYGLAVRVKYRNWWYVTKSRTVRVRHDSADGRPDTTNGNVKPYYTTSVLHYQARAYSRPIRFTTPRRGLLIVNRTKAPPPTHACTLTSTGHCIQGGEFCPQASYGMTGYDAAGRAWVCTGDSTHPHWE